MKKYIIASIVLLVIINIFVLSRIFFHSDCLGMEGFPWWPNVGCNCRGILIGNTGAIDMIGGSRAKYCIGILN